MQAAHAIPTIYAREFGAVPDNGQNAAPGVLAAIAHAQKTGAVRVQFEAGTYTFSGLPGWEEQPHPRASYAAIQNLRSVEIAGAVDAGGYPVTRWVAANDLLPGQPTILAVEGGENVTLRNIEVDMDPWYYSAGRVLEIRGDEVTIECLPGHPRIDGQPAYIMGTYDLAARKALVVRLTWDFDLPRWQVVGGDTSRLMRMSFAPLANTARVGDGVFWFQGNYCGPLLHFGHIHNLLIENVHILGGHGFPLTCQHCRDVTYRKVSLKPTGDRIATTCRDGFKLYNASGKLLMDRVHIEGCLGDDGQNAHGMWLSALEARGDRTLLAFTQGKKDLLTIGAEVALLDDRYQPAWRSRVTACERAGEDMLISFADPLPGWVHERTPVEPQEWLPDSLHVVDSVFRSTGRYGLYIKANHTLIENSLFENNVAAIKIGGEWSWGWWLESTNSRDVEIRGCTFRDNTLDIRYGGRKTDTAIVVSSWTRRDAPDLMQDIRIHDNLFEQEPLCVELANCRGVWFWNNTLRGCREAVRSDPETANEIHLNAPPVGAGDR